MHYEQGFDFFYPVRFPENILEITIFGLIYR